jgi:hypothetical protein
MKQYSFKIFGALMAAILTAILVLGHAPGPVYGVSILWIPAFWIFDVLDDFNSNG